MPSVWQEIQVQRLKDAISSEHLAREVAWPQAVRRFPRRPLSTCRQGWNIWECTENAKVAPATPPWQINREILGGASKQSQSMHFQYTRSIHLWTTSTSTQLQITSTAAHAANFLLCQLFSSAGICSAAFSLHHFQVIHNTQLCVGVFLYVLVLLSFSLHNFQILHISNFVLASLLHISRSAQAMLWHYPTGLMWVTKGFLSTFDIFMPCHALHLWTSSGKCFNIIGATWLW